MEYYFTYFIVFKSTSRNTNGPIITYNDIEDLKKASNGTMHLFDEDMNETLSAIEFIMHLPRNKFDLYDLDEKFMASSHDTPHHIIPIPEYGIPKSSVNGFVPTMFILTDDCDDAIRNRCNKLNPLLGTYYINELNEELIKKMWNLLWKYSKTEGFDKVSDIDVHFRLHAEFLKILPMLFISRQFGRTNEVMTELFNTTDLERKCVDIQWKNISSINTLVSLNNQGVNSLDDKIDKIYDEIYKVETSKFDVSVIITFPGISKLQMQYGASASTLSDYERRAIRIMGVHRAIARGGILMELSYANEELFRKFDELELRCKNGTNNKYVWKVLQDLGKLLGNYFNSFQMQELKRAKDITIFSDFPIGLAILDDEEVPLQCYKNISYRPLTPLTRHFQIEMGKSNQYYFGKKCKVAMAECIIDNEENRFVYPMSELVHSTLMDMEKSYSGLTVVYGQTYSVNSIKKFIKDNKDADVLYISAHGSYSRNQNMAGIIVGNEFWMASEDIEVQPIVILSACHVSPRGMGAVNIADMLIRNGASTVLGTFIPVDARRNLILMTRLFTYILEAQKGSKQYKTLDDAWCGIVSSNAIHELMSTSDSFKKWMHDTNSKGKVRIIEFQLERCVGRLRSSSIYSDTIIIVKEMLAEEGLQGKFGDILDMNNFFPESFFYQFIGYPENVFLYNEIFEEASNQNLLHTGL